MAGSRATLPHLNIGEQPEFSNPANFVRDPHGHSGGALRPSPGSAALRLRGDDTLAVALPAAGKGNVAPLWRGFLLSTSMRAAMKVALAALFRHEQRQKEKIHGGQATLKQVVIRWVTLLATPYSVIAFAQTKPLREVLPFVWAHHELSHPREILSVARDGDLAFDPFAYVFSTGFPDHTRYCVRKGGYSTM